jgi:hypothetical protein
MIFGRIQDPKPRAKTSFSQDALQDKITQRRSLTQYQWPQATRETSPRENDVGNNERRHEQRKSGEDSCISEASRAKPSKETPSQSED